MFKRIKRLFYEVKSTFVYIAKETNESKLLQKENSPVKNEEFSFDNLYIKTTINTNCVFLVINPRSSRSIFQNTVFTWIIDGETFTESALHNKNMEVRKRPDFLVLKLAPGKHSAQVVIRSSKDNSFEVSLTAMFTIPNQMEVNNKELQQEQQLLLQV